MNLMCKKVIFFSFFHSSVVTNMRAHAHTHTLQYCVQQIKLALHSLASLRLARLRNNNTAITCLAFSLFYEYVCIMCVITHQSSEQRGSKNTYTFEAKRISIYLVRAAIVFHSTVHWRSYLNSFPLTGMHNRKYPR